VSVAVVRTDRLLLRAFRDADREPFAAMNADPVVMEHFPAPLTREQSDAFVDRVGSTWAERGFGLWALQRLDDGAFVGYAGLWPVPPDVPVIAPAGVEVGWRLAADQWGNGFATEAAAAAVHHGFTVLGLPEVVSFTAAVNLRSRAVMRRLGMHRDATGDFDHPRVPPGHPARGHVLYRLAASATPPSPTGANPSRA
jgi:RimJ/RimL family protein N-acetyltransferase